MAAGDRGDVIISQTAFYGGMGTDNKIGIKNSFADTECMDARKSPSSLSVLPEASKLSSGDLGSLINSMHAVNKVNVVSLIYLIIMVKN